MQSVQVRGQWLHSLHLRIFASGQDSGLYVLLHLTEDSEDKAARQALGSHMQALSIRLENHCTHRI